MADVPNPEGRRLRRRRELIRRSLRFSLLSLLLAGFLLANGLGLYLFSAAWFPQCVLARHRSELMCAAFSADGALVATGDSAGTVTIFASGTGTKVRTLTKHQDIVSSVAFLPDGRRLVTGDWQGSVRIWDIETGTCLEDLTGCVRACLKLVCSEDGNKITAFQHVGPAVTWDLARPAAQPQMGELQYGARFDYIPRHDLAALITCDYDYALLVRRDSRLVAELFKGKKQRGKDPDVIDIALAPDGSFAVAGFPDGIAKTWEAPEWREGPILKGHQGAVNSVVFFPDSIRVATGSIDGSIKIWDARSGKCLVTLCGYVENIRCLAVSPLGDRLVAGEDVGTCHAPYVARLWVRRRPEWWWGIFYLPFFWLTVVFSLALAWSLRRDWLIFRQMKDRRSGLPGAAVPTKFAASSAATSGAASDAGPPPSQAPAPPAGTSPPPAMPASSSPEQPPLPPSPPPSPSAPDSAPAP